MKKKDVIVVSNSSRKEMFVIIRGLKYWSNKIRIIIEVTGIEDKIPQKMIKFFIDKLDDTAWFFHKRIILEFRYHILNYVLSNVPTKDLDLNQKRP